MSMALAGRTALILGANGHIARAVGEAGAHVVLAARDGGQLHQLRAELDAAGVTSRAIPTAVADDEAVRLLVDRAATDGMDIAVNNAGSTHRAVLGNLVVEDADRGIRVNAVAPGSIDSGGITAPARRAQAADRFLLVTRKPRKST
ncbi:MAG TPA: SDR family NAD(P)-dependent oxidoreductase [Jiangellaceae bacterium]|nr:SDR family NAD(P)-dependent oxidoreductase [Jiangellaceae bacterium]